MAVRKVMTVVGARPQFIKAAPVSMAIRAKGLAETIVHTGQHYDDGLSRVFFEQMGIPEEDYNLEVGSGTHAEQTARILERLEPIILQVAPDIVVVFGDTNSTLAAALVAVKLHIPVAHVEAGMRSFNRRMPEEINRVLTDHIATLHFCSTSTAEKNLAREGITDGVYVVGDVMADAVKNFAPKASLPEELSGLIPKGFIVLTCHRAENTDDPIRLGGVIDGVARLAKELPVVFPAHPRCVKNMREMGLIMPFGVVMIKPLPYLSMLALVRDAAVVATDSGGLQKEAYILGTPCVTLREETEWIETLETGCNQLAGSDPDRIEAALRNALSHPLPPDRPEFFGDGHAAQRIAAILHNYLV